MEKLEHLVQEVMVAVTTFTVVVVIVRAFLMEGRDRGSDKSDHADGETCPHCGQSLPFDGSSGRPTPAGGRALESENVIRPTAWTGREAKRIFHLRRWLLDLSKFDQNPPRTRSNRATDEKPPRTTVT
jgi:hypothetical protein